MLPFVLNFQTTSGFLVHPEKAHNTSTNRENFAIKKVALTPSILTPRAEHMKVRASFLAVLSFVFLSLFFLFFLTKHKLILCGPQQFFVYYPGLSFWLHQLFSGNIPWINNAVAGGMPLWADPNLGMFYPGNLLYLLLPFQHGWNAFLILHLFWGQFGVFWLCRKLGLTVSAAWTGAFVFLFCSSFLASLNSNEILATASWVPWILGLAYESAQRSSRAVVLTSLAFACQWSAGFTFIQLVTLCLVVAIFVSEYLRSREKAVFFRFARIAFLAVLPVSIQWVPSLLWLPHADASWLRIEPGFPALPYVGCLAGILFVAGLQNKLVWAFLICILLDYVLFGGSPVLALFFAMGAAFGLARLSQRFSRIVMGAIPILVIAELLVINWQIPRVMPVAQWNQVQQTVNQIPELRKWNVHYTGTRGALSPLAGLYGGLTYGTPPLPDSALASWKRVHSRTRAIENSLRTTGSLDLIREAGIGYVISDTQFHHPDLGIIKQSATKFYVHRMRVPVLPEVVSSNPFAKIHWVDSSPGSLSITTEDAQPSEITIHRNALPGWKCTLQGKELSVREHPHGWITVQVPPGNNKLDLTYRTPGAKTGTILTLLGTIVVLAFLIL